MARIVKSPAGTMDVIQKALEMVQRQATSAGLSTTLTAIMRTGDGAGDGPGRSITLTVYYDPQPKGVDG